MKPVGINISNSFILFLWVIMIASVPAKTSADEECCPLTKSYTVKKGDFLTKIIVENYTDNTCRDMTTPIFEFNKYLKEHTGGTGLTPPQLYRLEKRDMIPPEVIIEIEKRKRELNSNSIVENILKDNQGRGIIGKEDIDYIPDESVGKELALPCILPEGPYHKSTLILVEKDTNEPISDAVIFVDENNIGKTDSMGRIKDVELVEGEHAVRIKIKIEKDVYEYEDKFKFTPELNEIEVSIEKSIKGEEVQK